MARRFGAARLFSRRWAGGRGGRGRTTGMAMAVPFHMGASFAIDMCVRVALLRRPLLPPPLVAGAPPRCRPEGAGGRENRRVREEAARNKKASGGVYIPSGIARVGG